MQSTVSSADDAEAFELKGRMATLTVVRLLKDDNEALKTQLAAKVAKAPGMLLGVPAVLELGFFPEAVSEQLVEWVRILRGCRLVPVGVSGVTETLAEAAGSLGLGVFPDVSSANSERPVAVPPPGEQPPAFLPGRIVRQPVRSGQQIYARGGDLVVLSSVSPGAELLADGNIHVYGTLRGRALAGVQGYEEARILCLSLQAELVSVAGWYKLSEEMEASKGPVQVFLKGQKLCISSIKAH